MKNFIKKVVSVFKYDHTIMGKFSILYNNIVYKFKYSSWHCLELEDNKGNIINLDTSYGSKDYQKELTILIPKKRKITYYLHFSDKSFNQFIGNDIYVTNTYIDAYDFGNRVLNLLSFDKAYKNKKLYYLYVVKGPQRRRSSIEYEFIDKELEIIEKFTLDPNDHFYDELYYILKNKIYPKYDTINDNNWHHDEEIK